MIFWLFLFELYKSSNSAKRRVTTPRAERSEMGFTYVFDQYFQILQRHEP